MESRLDIYKIFKERACSSISAADLLLKEGYCAESISRSYYGIFYMVEALLLSEKQKTKSHAGAFALFSKSFIKTGKINSYFKDIYNEAMEDRQIADYSALLEISREKAQLRLKEAKEFVEETTNYLKNESFL